MFLIRKNELLRRLNPRQPVFVMLINSIKLVEIFCEIDDFCKVPEKLAAHVLPCSGSKHSVNIPSLSLSELMTIELLYHRSSHRCFQYYYEQEVLQGDLHSYFPCAPFLQPVCGVEAAYAAGTRLLFALFAFGCLAWYLLWG